ncbi:MAG: DNA gyrase subunit A [Phycisphaerae bacterium]|nr:DNA gyrase subunit A [Phycisphaerae bacterium]
MSDMPGPVTDLPIVDEMQDSYLRYAMSVIMARALPDVRDGLKPSQRRILVAMNDLNLGPRAAARKCAKIAGDTSGNYHPHGEAVIYPTLVRLAQGFNMRVPLVDGQGNFGSIDGDPPAAMRYTEARMTAAAVAMLEDLERETVDQVPNYDETRLEPVVLPSKFPNLLINGSIGIAVGMATSIPPHNPGEVCDALVAMIDRPDIELDELLKLVPGPDFPTGGMICGQRGIREAYETGRGNLILRAKLHVEETKSGREQIVVDEIPYNILKNTITERIAECVKEGRLPDVADVRDESDRKNPIRLVVELKKDANAEVVINQLYEFTPLQSNFVIINIALVGKQPRTMPLKELMQRFIDHRKDVITRRTRFLLRKARQRLHLVEALVLCLDSIDRIVAIIRAAGSAAEAKERLMKLPLALGKATERVARGAAAEISAEELVRRFAEIPEAHRKRLAGGEHFLTGVQADAILSMQLQRLTGLETQKLCQEFAKLVEEIDGYEAILRDPALVLDIIREDLYEIKAKFADARRTQFAPEVGEFRMDELIAREQMIVTLSHEGYIKRVPIDTYRKQGRGGRGLRASDTKEGDFLAHLFVASTHDYLLFFTNRGRVYWLRVYDIPEMARTARGRSIANLLRFQEGEFHTAVLPVTQFEEKFVFFATAKGRVKKTALGAFSRPRPSGIIAIGIDPDDTLINVALTNAGDNIVIATRDGMAVRFDESNVRAMGRGAAGVRGISLRGDDIVVDMAVARPGMSMLTVCENGYGKRTNLDEYRLQRRGGSGVINIRTTERNGRVVALRSVEDTDELMMITANGIMLRTAVAELREIGRATQGVRLIRVDEGDRVVAVAKIAPEDETAAQSASGSSSPPAMPVAPDAATPTDDDVSDDAGDDRDDADADAADDDSVDDSAEDSAPNDQTG